MVYYFFSFTAYKTVSEGSFLWCETAKSFLVSTQIVSLGQQKSSPQLFLPSSYSNLYIYTLTIYGY